MANPAPLCTSVVSVRPELTYALVTMAPVNVSAEMSGVATPLT